MGYKMATIKKMSAQTLKNLYLQFFFYKKCSVTQNANRLEPRSGPTYVGPDLGSSQFAILKKLLMYRYLK